MTRTAGAYGAAWAAAGEAERGTDFGRRYEETVRWQEGLAG